MTPDVGHFVCGCSGVLLLNSEITKFDVMSVKKKVVGAGGLCVLVNVSYMPSPPCRYRADHAASWTRREKKFRQWQDTCLKTQICIFSLS